MKTVKPKTVKFIDKDNNLVEVVFDIRKFNDTIEMFFIGETNGSYGQIDFNPRTHAQVELKRLWKKYHLNGMAPGTPKQMEALEKVDIKDFNKQVEYLKELNLYCDNITIYNDDYIFSGGVKDDMYCYGNGWVFRKIDDDDIDCVLNVLENIEFEHENMIKEIKRKVEMDESKITDREKALTEHLQISIAEALTFIKEISKTEYQYLGRTYYVLTDKEADKLLYEMACDYVDEVINQAKKDVKDSFIYKYFDYRAYAKDIKLAGERGKVIALYDGVEHEYEVNGKTYYIYRMN